MPDSLHLSIEKKLAVAHRMLWEAASEAESLRDQSLSDDLYGLTAEVGRINTDLLTSTRPRRPRSPSVRI